MKLKKLKCAFFLLAANAAAQTAANYQYVIKPLAGTSSTGNGLPATQALFKQPLAVIAEASGGYAVLDSSNQQIRRVGADGVVTLVANLNADCVDMEIARDGSFYVTATAQVLKVSPAGAVSVFAGTGVPGSSGDGGPAASALLDASVTGIALDAAGNVYFVDGSRVRKVNVAGIITTVAGGKQEGFSGDNGPASAARLNYPKGLAIDAAGNLYIPDLLNYRVRKVTASNGVITTIAGNGNYGAAVNGPAINSPLGFPYNIAVDGSGVYFTDIGSGVVSKIDAGGVLTRLAGGGAFSYADGPAASAYLDGLAGIAIEASGNVLITEIGTHRVRRISAGTIRTVAGRIRTGGDGGSASAAVLNSPLGADFDGLGNLYIADGQSYRVRKVAADGVISTLAGTGNPGPAAAGASAAATPIPNHYAVAADTKGNVFIAARNQVLRVNASGAIDVYAGTGTAGNSGDGGAATAASFLFISGLATDAAGNLYIGDHASNRVRKVSGADGTISAFAGTGTAGFGGDGGAAAAAQLRPFYSLPLATDAGGNVYIGDGGNYRVRVVSPAGVITTIAGNGQPGEPADGSRASGAPLNIVTGVAVDEAGGVYVAATAAQYFGSHSIYRVEGGAIRAIAGQGSAPVADDIPANTTRGFDSHGMRTDSNGDLIVADYNGSVVRKLMRNSPRELVALDGGNQSAAPGAVLPKPLRVRVNGRAGLGVAGEPVAFKVTSGEATLSAASVTADDTGAAGVNVTLGGRGLVVVTATVTGLPPVTFSATAGSPGLLLSPDSLLFSYTIGAGPPEAQAIAVQGSTAFSAMAAADGDVAWLVAEVVEGAVRVSVTNLDQLEAGAYKGIVTVSADGVEPRVAAVSLAVADVSMARKR